MTTNKNTIQHHAFKDCPATAIREITVSSKTVAIEEDSIALIRPLLPKKREQYIKNNHIPLKDLCKFMHSLSSELRGELSVIKDSKLKKLILPIMLPTGVELPSMPDENAYHLVIVSHGKWHGVIFCSEVADKVQTMVKSKKARNGDIAGIGYLEDAREVLLLDVSSILTREGFLAIT